MTLAIIAFTQQGLSLGERVQASLRAQGDTVRLTRGFGHEKHPPLRVWAGRAMRDHDALLFIGATGIAVRAVAPHLRGKQADPAVVVMDEQGRYAISLLSGHAGGANRLARRVAEAIGATPVITTATDGRGVFAVDAWAKAHGLTLLNPEAAKAVSAALLASRAVGLVCDYPIDGDVPAGMAAGTGADAGLCIGVDGRRRPFETTLYAVPAVLVLGIGCRKDVSQAALHRRVELALGTIGSAEAAVRAVHTIDRKAREPGLVGMCAANRWPLRAFPAEALRAVPGHFTASRLVEETVGVDNVCERAAMIDGGRLLLPKQSGDGVTVAIAQMPCTISFLEVDACTSL